MILYITIFTINYVVYADFNQNKQACKHLNHITGNVRFVLYARKKVMRIWNYMREHNISPNLHFWMNN